MFDNTTQQGVIYNNIAGIIVALLMFLFIYNLGYIVTNIIASIAFLALICAVYVGCSNIVNSELLAKINRHAQSDD